MQTNDIRVMIMIPVYNAINLIDRTIQSIRNQSYDADKIFIYVLDFGSTDGTYEKLLEYDNYHLAVFQVQHKRIERTMIADVKNSIIYQGAGGGWCYDFLLEPGDELYPDFLKKNIALYYNNRIYNPSRLWCEVDIRRADGSIEHPVPLYNSSCVLSAYDNALEFINHGYVHEMLVFGKQLGNDKARNVGYENEGRYWSKGVIAGVETNSIYNPEVLACRVEKNFKDELEEILLRWEQIIFFIRGYFAKYKNGLDLPITATAEKCIAYYALWRCCKRFGDLPDEHLMNCFDMAAVIYPEIRSNFLYQEFLSAKKKSDLDKIREIALQIEKVETRKALHNKRLVI